MLKPDTMHIKEFRYLRMPNVAAGSAWQQIPELEPIWGIVFPTSAIKLRCVKEKATVIIQETIRAKSRVPLHFKLGARVVILGNAFIYFQDGLAD